MRFRSYQRRHGLAATVRRGGLALRRALFARRMVVFYCDLAKQNLREVAVPSHLKIGRLVAESEVSKLDFDAMCSFWNPKLAQHNIKERFAKGASLWLIKSESSLAGYGWTLQGRTIEPYFFPLGADDVHLFDFQVFPQFRGRGLNPILVGHILRSLARDCSGRAFIEAAEWNEAQLSSLRKTPFRRLGMAGSATLLGRKFTSWAEVVLAERTQQTKQARDKAPALAATHDR